MSPRSADPTIRTEFIEAAARILAEDGSQALTTRRLAKEVGTSTMAVYTYFGGMTQLKKAIQQEGFARLKTRLDTLSASDDPVADLVAAGAAYLDYGLSNPHLYRAMFAERPSGEPPETGGDAFHRLVNAVRRCIEAGRFDQVDERMTTGWAIQIWATRHGLINLASAGILPAEHVPLLASDVTMRLLIGYGDAPETAERSLRLGLNRKETAKKH